MRTKVRYTERRGHGAHARFAAAREPRKALRHCRRTPTQIIWSDGTRFDIQRVLDARPARSMTTGQEGTRYKIRVRGQDTYLWFEGPRWFVEAKMGSPG